MSWERKSKESCLKTMQGISAYLWLLSEIWRKELKIIWRTVCVSDSSPTCVELCGSPEALRSYGAQEATMHSLREKGLATFSFSPPDIPELDLGLETQRVELSIPA